MSKETSTVASSEKVVVAAAAVEEEAAGIEADVEEAVIEIETCHPWLTVPPAINTATHTV